ncbi:cyclic nucleotide-binding domain-containing protein [Thermodesulfobacteriota bacterium]
MADSNTQEMAIEAIVILNAAFTNIRLYPPTSDMIGNTVNRAYSIFQDIFNQDDSVVFAESEGNLIISGQVLSEADKKKPQIIAFTKLMLSLSIKSMSFDKGLQKEEILSFLEVVSKKPEDFEKEGGVSEVMITSGIKNIHIDKKLFVAMGKDEQIVAAGATVVEDSEAVNGAVPEEKETDPSDDRRTGVDRRVDDGLDHLANGGPERRKEEQRKQQVLQIQNGINSMLKGDDKVFLDPVIMKALPPTILRTYSQGKEEKALKIINRLCKGLLNKEDKVRAQVSVVLAHICIKFMRDNRIDGMVKLMPGLIKWIKFETIVSSPYKHICIQLKSAALNLISNNRVAEGNQILEPFHLIYSGNISMPEEIKKISEELLKGTASMDLFNNLLNEFGKSEDDISDQVINTFAFMTPWSTKFLLKTLKELPESESLGNLKEKVLLQEHICTALGRTGSHDAIPLLNLILERKDPLNTDIFNKGVQDAAKNALDMIKQGPDKKGEAKAPPEEKTEQPDPADKAVSGETESGDNGLSEQLKSVDKYVNEGDTETAVKLLFDMVVEYTGKKDFENADLLRDKLMEVNPMALTEIVKSGEVIDEARSEAIDPDRLKAWSEIYDKLNDSETQTLYFAMKPAEYDAGKTVFNQGELDSRLYFINSGMIKLIFKKDDEEILIKELETGDIFGQETFFAMTVCTVSAVTATRAELEYLEKDTVTKWEKDIPGLIQKINDHCLKLEKASEILNKKGENRRTHERVNISGQISIQTLDSTGSPAGEPTKGSLADISMGGISFFVKTSKERAEKIFLDQKVNVKFSVKAGDSKQEMDQKGVAVAVLTHLYDYSVHIKFDNLLDEKTFEDIKESAGSEDEELDILIDS